MVSLMEINNDSYRRYACVRENRDIIELSDESFYMLYLDDSFKII